MRVTDVARRPVAVTPPALAALAALTVSLAAAMCLTGELRTEERARLKRWTRALLRPVTVPL